MAYGLRPFFQRLGVALRGPDDPRAARRAAQETRRAELLRVINRAGAFDALTREPAWVLLQEEWAGRQRELMQALRKSATADFSAAQAALDGYEEAANVVTRAKDAAQRAHEELEGMSDA